MPAAYQTFTAFNFYGVNTRVETLKNQPDETCDSRINILLYPTPPDIFSIPQTSQQTDSVWPHQPIHHDQNKPN